MPNQRKVIVDLKSNSNTLETRPRPGRLGRIAVEAFVLSILVLGISAAAWATAWLWSNLP